MKKEIWFVNFRAKSIKEVWINDQKKIEIEWYASTKDKDRYGDVVEPGAFTKTMATYMENPMLLLQHDPSRQIWVVTGYSIDATWLYIQWDVKYTAGDDELFDKITNGDLKWFSIWFRIKELELLEEIENGQTIWTWIIKELELLEISVVTIPANPYTLMKSLDDLFKKSFDEVWQEWETIEDDEKQEETTEETPRENEDEKPKENPNNDKESPESVEEEQKTDGEHEEKDDKEIEVIAWDDTPTEQPTSDEPEKQDETPASIETPTGKDEEKQENSFTLKMIDKIIGAKTEAMEKQFQAKEKEIKDDLTKSFDEKLKSFEEANETALKWLLEIIQSQTSQIKSLSDWLANMTSGKWFIYREAKAVEDSRDKSLLKSFQKAKQLS